MKFFLLGLLILLATECNAKSTPPDDDGSQFKTTTAMTDNTMDSIDDPKGADVRELLDIVHTPGQLGERKEEDEEAAPTQHKSRQKRKAARNEELRWTNKTIPYVLGKKSFSRNYKNLIRIAMKHWEANTCIRFVRKRYHNENFIRFKKAKTKICSSEVGMQGDGRQFITLSDGCSVTTIIHEIGHAVGFHHEHSRPDRDDYVKINLGNVREGQHKNFGKLTEREVNTFGVPYDYHSVMHYQPWEFAKDGKRALRARDKSVKDKIGRVKGLSFRDSKLANLMYRCDEHCKSRPTCPGEGFVNKDCQCMCPGNPVRPCVSKGLDITREPTNESYNKKVKKNAPHTAKERGKRLPTTYHAIKAWENYTCIRVPRKGHLRRSKFIGKARNFHEIKSANLRYACHEHCEPRPNCPGEGFVGKDCQCYCPGKPVKTCSVKKTDGDTDMMNNRQNVSDGEIYTEKTKRKPSCRIRMRKGKVFTKSRKRLCNLIYVWETHTCIRVPRIFSRPKYAVLDKVPNFRNIKLQNQWYRCAEHCNSRPTCPGEGFVNKDCQCMCPGNPVRPCVG